MVVKITRELRIFKRDTAFPFLALYHSEEKLDRWEEVMLGEEVYAFLGKLELRALPLMRDPDQFILVNDVDENDCACSAVVIDKTSTSVH